MHLVKSLKQSTADIRIFWILAFLRMSSYGLCNQVLTLFLESLGISGSLIGLFMTLTMGGDIVITYFLTWYADRIGRRVVLVVGSLMMIASGLVFAYFSDFNILLIAAVIGVISPSGEENGPFKSIEEASIAHITPFNHRPEVFAFYSLISAGGAAFGSLICGLVVDYLHLQREMELISCYRVIFLIYALVAMIKIVLMLFLSKKCEIEVAEINDSDVTEETSLLGSSELNLELEELPSSKTNFFGLTAKTSFYLSRLIVIFMLDSLGYGFMPAAWIVFYFKKSFLISATGMGALFFVLNFVNATSSIPSAYLSKLLGSVRAILVTQAPSAVFVMLIAATNNLHIASALLILYYTTSSMDVVPRQILLTTLVPSFELTKVMSIVNIGKTFARCFGPIVTGKLQEHGYLRYGFVLNGSCVLLADLILACSFLQLDSMLLHQANNEHD